MDNLRATRICEKCKAVVPSQNIKLYPKPDNTNLLLCEACLNQIKAVNKSIQEGKSEKITNLPPADFANLFCTRCNYAFRVNRSKIGVTLHLSCPYCSKNDKLVRR